MDESAPPATWVVSGPPDVDEPGNEWHVLPAHDLKPHEESSTCACRPRLDDEYHEVHNRRIYIHNSYDRREFTYEKGLVH
jgi:hypothetical protein